MKMFWIFLFITSSLWAGEAGIWQIYRSSFTQAQWDTLKNVVVIKVANAKIPTSMFRVHKRKNGIAIQADISVQDLIKVQVAEETGKIRYICSYHYHRILPDGRKEGYNREHECYSILQNFWYEMDKSTYTVECSSCP